ADVLPAVAQTTPESDSDSGMGSPVEEMAAEAEQEQEKRADMEEEDGKVKKREKSQRNRKKKGKHSKAVENLKKKDERFCEGDELLKVNVCFLEVFLKRFRRKHPLNKLQSWKQYSEQMLQTPSAPPDVDTPTQPSTEQDAPPSIDLSSNQIQSLPEPAATLSPQQENLHAEAAEGPEPEPELGPLLLLSESLQESLGADAVKEPVPDSGAETPAVYSEQNRAAVASEVQQTEPQPDPVSESASEPTKPKKDKLARLKELGLDPPPVAKLCPDDGPFVQLEPPHCNPGHTQISTLTGVEALKERYLRHIHGPVRPPVERTMHLTIIRKDSAPSGQEELHAESVTGVDDLLGGDGGEKEEEESMAQSVRSLSPAAQTPDLVNTDGTLMLFPGSSCSRTG
ncbi:hypothetical protein XENOCAPTIV_027320, partial [Xenoophorus captivus]